MLAELSEELALELFYDTFRTVLEPALMTVPLRGLKNGISDIINDKQVKSSQV